MTTFLDHTVMLGYQHNCAIRYRNRKKITNWRIKLNKSKSTFISFTNKNKKRLSVSPSVLAMCVSNQSTLLSILGWHLISNSDGDNTLRLLHRKFKKIDWLLDRYSSYNKLILYKHIPQVAAMKITWSYWNNIVLQFGMSTITKGHHERDQLAEFWMFFTMNFLVSGLAPLLTRIPKLFRYFGSTLMKIFTTARVFSPQLVKQLK